MPSIRTLNIDAADQCVQASELRDSLSELLTAMRVTSVLPVRFESSGGYAMRFPYLDQRGARAQRF